MGATLGIRDGYLYVLKPKVQQTGEGFVQYEAMEIYGNLVSGVNINGGCNCRESRLYIYAPNQVCETKWKVQV